MRAFHYSSNPKNLSLISQSNLAPWHPAQTLPRHCKARFHRRKNINRGKSWNRFKAFSALLSLSLSFPRTALINQPRDGRYITILFHNIEIDVYTGGWPARIVKVMSYEVTKHKEMLSFENLWIPDVIYAHDSFIMLPPLSAYKSNWTARRWVIMTAVWGRRQKRGRRHGDEKSWKSNGETTSTRKKVCFSCSFCWF